MKNNWGPVKDVGVTLLPQGCWRKFVKKNDYSLAERIF